MFKQRYKILSLAVAVTLLIGFGVWYLTTQDIAVLNPSGSIADQQRSLLITATLLMLIVVVPVLVMAFGFAWRFRAGNKKAKYRPDWDSNRFLETMWWGIPLCIILVLAVITWQTSHKLDPSRALESDVKPLTIQVVALQWKWLFIYPEQQVASVNFVQFPEDRPVSFELTADAPMNSFWIPKLAGQIYTMNGMSTKLHIIADEPGDYPGVSANISGEGFAGMRFTARASSQMEFDTWIESTRNANQTLTLPAYEALTMPSENNKPELFAGVEPGLYATIIMKYMSHMSDGGHEEHSYGH